MLRALKTLLYAFDGGESAAESGIAQNLEDDLALAGVLSKAVGDYTLVIRFFSGAAQLVCRELESMNWEGVAVAVTQLFLCDE